jgi:hypothetical protein
VTSAREFVAIPFVGMGEANGEGEGAGFGESETVGAGDGERRVAGEIAVAGEELLIAISVDLAE